MTDDPDPETELDLDPLSPGDELPPTRTPATGVPARLGRYEVTSLLARGGMGAVFKARDPALDRTVAVKTVQAILLDTDQRDEFLERFRREARAAGRLAHPHIVAIHDFGLDEATATPFIVMEYVAGVSLETLLKEQPTLPVEQALDIVQQVSSAVEEAHAHGIVHRDIKPANVFRDERGRVKVGDFGIARLDGSDLTVAGVTLGTPGYAAPEIVRGQTADARSDVFALGALAYRLLTGEKPFRGVTRETIAVDVLEWDPPPPHTVRPEVPAHVSAAVMRALAKSPEARTATAADFSREMRGGTDAPIVTPVVPVTVPVATAPAALARTQGPATATVESMAPPRRGSRLWVAAAALLIAALAIGLGLAWLFLRGPDAAPAAAVPPPTMRPAALTPSPRPPSPRPAARPAQAQAPAPAPRDTRPASDPRLDQLKSVLDRVLQEADRAEERSRDDAPAEPANKKGRGKARGKGKKH